MTVLKVKAGRTLGFTLIEIVMVLVIVSVLSAATLPRFFSVSAYNQAVYYSEVLNSLRYARKLAVATGSHIQVNVTGTSLALVRRIEGSNCTTGTTFQAINDPASQSLGYTKVAPGQVSLTFSANWPLYFDALGQATQASTCSVVGTDTITVAGGNTVTVSGATGFVQ